jgi:hypothetical protein
MFNCKAVVHRFFILFLCVGLAVGYSSTRFKFSFESGMATAGYSDIRIPGTTGTLISFSEELETDPTVFVRGRFTYYFGRSNSLSILYAPLTLNASGSVDREVIFEDETFDPNVELDGVFRFNSYRLSYQHYWFIGDKLDVGLGITAKVRDAAISLEDATHPSEKTNIGFVPLIRFSLVWRFISPFAFFLDGDALAAPQGRAEDISIGIQGDVTDRMSLRMGYRVLEGGSNVDEVYSFTWVNFFYGGFSIRL